MSTNAGVQSLAAKQVWPWAGKRRVQILLQIVEILSTFCNNFSTGLNVRGWGGGGGGGGNAQLCLSTSAAMFMFCCPFYRILRKKYQPDGLSVSYEYTTSVVMVL